MGKSIIGKLEEKVVAARLCGVSVDSILESALRQCEERLNSNKTRQRLLMSFFDKQLNKLEKPGTPPELGKLYHHDGSCMPVGGESFVDVHFRSGHKLSTKAKYVRWLWKDAYEKGEDDAADVVGFTVIMF